MSLLGTGPRAEFARVGELLELVEGDWRHVWRWLTTRTSLQQLHPGYPVFEVGQRLGQLHAPAVACSRRARIRGVARTCHLRAKPHVDTHRHPMLLATPQAPLATCTALPARHINI